MTLHWKDLKVWQKVHQLVLEVYRVTTSFPKAEIYGVTSQLRRAASSIPANIVEGQSRQTTKEYLQFLYNARGSLEEVRYSLLLSHDLNFLTFFHFQSSSFNLQCYHLCTSIFDLKFMIKKTSSNSFSKIVDFIIPLPRRGSCTRNEQSFNISAFA